MELDRLKILQSEYWQEFCDFHLMDLREKTLESYGQCKSEADFREVRAKIEMIDFIKSYPQNLIELQESL